MKKKNLTFVVEVGADDGMEVGTGDKLGLDDDTNDVAELGEDDGIDVGAFKRDGKDCI